MKWTELMESRVRHQFVHGECVRHDRPPAAGDAQPEFHGSTQSQQYCDWVLVLNQLRIIGAWTNVPSAALRSRVDRLGDQRQVKTAPTDRPSLVAGPLPRTRSTAISAAPRRSASTTAVSRRLTAGRT
jgi:hypothetical protein